jgi:hypothetical protein
VFYYYIQHHGPATHLPALVRLLDGPNVHIHLNYDARKEDVTEAARLLDFASAVTVSHSKPVIWGGPSQVRVFLDQLWAAVEISGWEYFINLSGSCVPIVSSRGIAARLEDFKRHGFIDFVHHFPALRKPTKIAYAHDNVDGPKGLRAAVWGQRDIVKMFSDGKVSPIRNPQNRVFIKAYEQYSNRSLYVCGPTQRELRKLERFFEEHAHICGRAWYILSRSTCETLCQGLLAGRFDQYLEVFFNCFEPDESFLQTLLFNSSDFPKHRIWNSNLRFRNGIPGVITDDHFEELSRSDALFVRKVTHARADRVLRLALRSVSAGA